MGMMGVPGQNPIGAVGPGGASMPAAGPMGGAQMAGQLAGAASRTA